MKKIIIIGSGGAGKSTLALQLGKILNIPVYHLDRINWRPGWIEINKSEFREQLIAVLGENEWIIDGNYEGTMQLRIDHCDTIIFLDYKRYQCYLGYLKRYIRYKGKSRPSMTDGCDERFDLEYIRWIWGYPKRKDRILKKVSGYNDTKKVLIFNNRDDTNNFLESLMKKSPVNLSLS